MELRLGSGLRWQSVAVLLSVMELRLGSLMVSGLASAMEWESPK
jgi:hypothetical protein